MIAEFAESAEQKPLGLSGPGGFFILLGGYYKINLTGILIYDKMGMVEIANPFVL
jgi:hypothetical protein